MYLPWEKGRNFRTHPWEPGQGNLSPAIYTAVETALLTEVNLPWFTSGLNDTFRGSLEVLQKFVHTWTAEEDQHSDLLSTYLLLTRNGDPMAMHQMRKDVVQGGWVPPMESPLQVMVYTSMQELATQVFYLNVARACEAEDADLAALLRRLAKDETLHYAFYRDAVKAHLEVDPNYIWPVADVMMQFAMPGAGMPDYEQRMITIAKSANYGPEHYYRQVVDVLCKHWDVFNLHPTFAEALEAQDKIRTYHNRLRRVAERAARRAAGQSERSAD